MQTINIKEREDNLSNYCPVCGVCSASAEGEITPCPHLLFVYLNIGDGLMYLRDDLKKDFPNEDDLSKDVDEMEYLLSLDLDRSFAIEETGTGPSLSYYLIGYQFFE